MKIMPAQKGNILLPLISAFAIVAIVAAGYFYLQSQQNKQPVSTNGLSSTPTPIRQDETTSWETYATSKYTIKYPSDWKIYLTPLEREESFTIKNNYPQDHYPTFYIEFNSLSNTSLYVQEQGYIRQGLEKDEVKIAGLNAIRYMGTSNKKATIEGGEISANIQEKHLLLEHDGNLYMFGYAYESKFIDAAKEEVFSQILSTFKFTEK